jgi:putative FmdB family regulatory protein
VPTYEYRCKGCGRHLEVVQAFTDDALTTCEDCGGDLRKVFGSVGISFKGSGFYKTDSRSSSSATAGSSSSDKGSTDSGSSDKGSSDKGSSDKGSSDKGSSDKAGASAASSTASAPASS